MIVAHALSFNVLNDAQDGRVQPGDQVLCVNGQNLLGKSNSDAMVVLKKALAEIKPATNMIQLVCVAVAIILLLQLMPYTSVGC